MDAEKITYQAILDAPNLDIGYRTKKGDIPIAKQLNLHIFKGEMVCLLGPNGSGKSTLIRTLAGMQKSLSGDIYIQNQRLEPQHARELSQLMSVVLTERIAVSHMTVYELVSLGRFPHTNWLGKLSEEDHTQIEKSIEQVGLGTFRTRFVNTLSDGERQRVMIAKALAQDTPFIMLDEPTAHLDLPNRIEIMKLLKELAQQTYKSILLSTHELDLALQVADRIWLMQTDKPLLCGTPEDLVLNGSFEQAFKKQSFDFDRASGLFKINYQHSHSISISGDPIRMFWTKRALNRHGYKIAEQHTDIPHIDVSETTWTLSYNSKHSECSSIFELLIAINGVERE
ncbi:MAG: ABC transporter ATP-binding protein [Bacteroidales bacterium]